VKKRFTSLEKAADSRRQSADFCADGGLMPPSAKTFGGRSSLKGVTFIELVVVIVLLGILAAIAVTRFVDFKKDAERTAEAATVSAIQSGINNQFIKNQFSE
jgi:prepilin-type N-terminal cleavage/methylation domain-containing protein